ncbi:MAG: protein translocase subunit SecD [Candidatus Kapabacteria bacterium]|nr:protein translocase subunit SecD [Ignavibacteriota bacterium]MCW5885470.1 protein translocase subunit SecD [Candidatus Kapabacteria bacterium]
MKLNWGKLLLVILPVVAAIAVMIPTYQASQLETKEKEFRNRALKAGNSEDSLAIIEEFRRLHGQDLTDLKKNQLKLGLDLRGGMYVTLEADIVKLIEETAQSESIDELFIAVINKTKEDAASTDQDGLDIFLKNFNEIARPKGKSLISYFDIGDFRDASEEKIIERLRKNADDAIDQAQEVIRQRIDQFGVSEPNIQKVGTNRIILELPGVENQEQMRNLLQTTARLEFNLVKNNADIVRAFTRIDKFLAEQLRKRRGEAPKEPTAVEQAVESIDSITVASQTPADTATAESDTTALADGQKAKSDTTNPYEGLSEDEIRKKHTEEHPFTTLFATYFVPPQENARWVEYYYTTDDVPTEGEFSFRIIKDSMDRFNEILNRPEIRSFIPIDYKIVVEAKPDKRLLKESNVEVYEFYSLKRDPELTGEVITDALQSFDPTTNAPMVNMTMNDEGADRWARITGANLKKRIAIVLDERVYSAPVVQAKITGGRSQITGMANMEEARLLEVVLKAGALKAPVKIIEERVVGPSLGQDSINAGFRASMAGLIIVIIYMVFYYNRAGLVADFAVLLNITLIISVLTALKGTLTLPGIAGIVLTMGMAVDANVLIFERIREELAKGRSLRSAIDEGFGKALSAIIDGNITTGITAFILLVFGSGPIQGFATTLLIGILTTLFTGILITRALLELQLSGGATKFSFGQPKETATA